MGGSCSQNCGAAREHYCSCEGGSKRQVLEGGGGASDAAGVTKTGRGIAAVQGGIPDQNSFSSCWGWDSPL